MAEVTAKNLYGQLSPMGQMYYDQQFSKQYICFYVAKMFVFLP